MFVGITFPFFGGLLGFFGGFAFAPTTYFVSALFFLNKNNFLCFKKTNLFFLPSSAPLYNVACHLQTKEIQPILDRKLGMQNSPNFLLFL